MPLFQSIIDQSKRKAARFSLGIALAGALTANVSAETDLSFSLKGAINGVVYAVAVDNALISENAQANIFIGGDFSSVYGSSCYGLAVLNPDGSLESIPDLGPDFYAGNIVYSLYVDGEDRVYIGSLLGVTRLVPGLIGTTNSWVVDTSFGDGAQTSPAVTRATSITFNQGGNELIVANNGNISVFDAFGNGESGQFPHDSSIYKVSQARYTANHLDLAGAFGVGTLATDGTKEVYDTVTLDSACTERAETAENGCVSAYGELIGAGLLSPSFIPGSYPLGGHITLARFGGDSLLTSAYFHPINSLVNVGDVGQGIGDVVALDGGDLLVTGSFTSLGGVAVNNLAHLNADGTVDKSFGNSIGLVGMAFAQQPDGKYVIVGYNPNGGTDLGLVARIVALPASVALSVAQNPVNVTAYEGDPVCLSASFNGYPAPSLDWQTNYGGVGYSIPGETAGDLCFDPVTTSDSGAYQLQASPFCGAQVTTSAAQLTVLPAPPAPGNDLFANAYLLTGISVTTNGYVRSSTLEAGEPDPTGGDDGHSVWYTWTAPTDGITTIDVSQSDFAAVPAVFTGPAVNSLSLVTDAVSRSVSFISAAGTTYQIAVGGTPKAGSLGNIALKLTEIIPHTSWVTSYSNGAFSLFGVAAGAGNLVAAGAPPLIESSSNTAVWITDAIGLDTNYIIDTVSYANGLFLAGGYGVIATSSNAANWNLDYLSLTTNYIFGSAYANGLYVTAAQGGTILSSPDGVTWTTRAIGLAYNAGDWLYSVAYGNGVFVAVGDDGSVVTSEDGIHWALSATQIGISNGDSLYSVAYGNGVFVAVGDEASIVTSRNGTNWAPQKLVVPVQSYLQGVAFGDGRFVAVGGDGLIAISTDGTNWLRDNSGSTANFNGVCYYQSGRFVAVAQDGSILINQLPTFHFMSAGNGEFVFDLVGLSGATAVIEATTTLSPPNWQPIQTNVFSSGTVTVTINSTGTSEYFRAVVR